MNVRCIFVCDKFKVYSAQFGLEYKIRDIDSELDFEDGNVESLDELDEYTKAMQRWGDADYLRNLFSHFRRDLNVYWPGVPVSVAAERTRKDAQNLNDLFEQICDAEDENRLHLLFKPLHNDEVEVVPYEGQETKVHGYVMDGKSCLRLYALRYENCYLITGSGIKLTNTMKERKHLQAELFKLKKAAELVGTVGIAKYLESWTK